MKKRLIALIRYSLYIERVRNNVIQAVYNAFMRKTGERRFVLLTVSAVRKIVTIFYVHFIGRFSPRYAMLARYVTWLSVRPSVCLSQVWEFYQRLNVYDHANNVAQ